MIGLVAAALTTIGFIPQAVKTIKTRNTQDLSLHMYIILTVGVFSWLAYGILTADLPVILANAVTSIFIVTILIPVNSTERRVINLVEPRRGDRVIQVKRVITVTATSFTEEQDLAGVSGVDISHHW